MRVIIAGSRGITEYDIVLGAVDAAALLMKIEPTVVLSGDAPGVDRLGEKIADLAGWKVELHKADWSKFGKRAGYVRNTYMANNAEALIAVWDSKSKGTKHMIDIARDKHLIVYVHHVTK